MLTSWLLTMTIALQVTVPMPPSEARQYPPAFPRQNATKLLETDDIVVWDIVWPKGQPSPMHRHRFDQVGTYYQAGGRVITSVNGTKSENTTPVGNISTTRKGTTHIEEGTTDPPLRAVFIELKSDTPANPNRAQSAPPAAGARQVHSEDRVTVWDVTWMSGTHVQRRYDRETAVVWLTPGALRVQAEGKTAEDVSVRPGTFWYRPTGVVETLQFGEGSPRAIVFEF